MLKQISDVLLLSATPKRKKKQNEKLVDVKKAFRRRKSLFRCQKIALATPLIAYPNYLKAAQCKLRKARQGKARCSKKRQGSARQGYGRQGRARQGNARWGETRQDKTRQDETKQGETRQEVGEEEMREGDKDVEKEDEIKKMG